MVLLNQVGDGVFRGEGTHVNWLVLQDGSDLTLIDGGYPRDADRVRAGVASLGRSIGDIRAVLVTHAHVDHAGGAAVIAAEARCPVYAHPSELPNVRGDRLEQAGPLDVAVRAWRPSVLRWAMGIVRVGGTQHPVLPQVRGFVSDGPLDLPGAPEPVPTPGHTSGHCGYLMRDAGVVATGDALVTGHPLSNRVEPQLLPEFFGADREREQASYEVLAALDVDGVVPGHGDVWRGGLAHG